MTRTESGNEEDMRLNLGFFLKKRKFVREFVREELTLFVENVRVMETGKRYFTGWKMR